MDATLEAINALKQQKLEVPGRGSARNQTACQDTRLVHGHIASRIRMARNLLARGLGLKPTEIVCRTRLRSYMEIAPSAVIARLIFAGQAYNMLSMRQSDNER